MKAREVLNYVLYDHDKGNFRVNISSFRNPMKPVSHNQRQIHVVEAFLF